MTYAITSKSETDACCRAISEVFLQGKRVKRSLEISPLVIFIPYSPERFTYFAERRYEYGELLGIRGLKAIERTARVYTSEKNRVSKPSYRSRLENFPDTASRPVPLNAINQIDKIVSEVSAFPRASTHVFTFFRPSDLYNKRWPGYVPCPTSGDFKYRDGKLSLNVMFRSCDILNFLYNDIYYLRQIQFSILRKAKEADGSKLPPTTQPGPLNLFLSRAFIQTWEITPIQNLVEVIDSTKEFLERC
ncbi:thymidylate synthase [Mesorhizobium sp. RSR380A]